MSKEELLEDMSNHIAVTFGYPPLTASIYAWLVLDLEREGVSFSELQEITKASKSSVSNALQVLVQNKHVEYFTKFGERARTYRLTDKFVFQKMEKIREYIEDEKRMIVKFKKYMADERHLEKCKMFSQSDIYEEHIDKELALIKSVEEKLRNLEKVNNSY